MFRTYPAALAAALALTVTSLAGAQQPAGDTTAHHPKPSPTRDERQDARVIAADRARLQHDIGLRDSTRARLVQDRNRLPTEEARIDSLKAALTSARKAHDTAAERRDLAELTRARKVYDQDLDRFKREGAVLAKLDKRADAQEDAIAAARHDLRADRSAQRRPDSAQDVRQAMRRDVHQDARTIATDSARLQREIALRDSTRKMLAQDRTLTRADEARLDSLQAALAKARKTNDAAAVNRDLAAVTQAKRTLEGDKDRDQHERAQLASIDQKVSRESNATADARHDLRADRSALEHPSSKGHRR
jgi:hypothetical protein